MAGREVREYTNLTDPKGIHPSIHPHIHSNVYLQLLCFNRYGVLYFSLNVVDVFADRKSGKGKDRIDDEDITFQRMVAKVSQLTLSLFSLLVFELGNQVLN